MANLPSPIHVPAVATVGLMGREGISLCMLLLSVSFYLIFAGVIGGLAVFIS